MTINVLLNNLEKVREKGRGRYEACCPSHSDKNPSLAIKLMQDGRILMHCHAGCSTSDIVATLGLTMSSLFPDGALGELRGWEQLKKKNDVVDKDGLILAMANEDREKGKKLSKVNLKIEREAYVRSREKQNNENFGR